MPTPSNLFLNYTACTFTPASGSPVTISKVTDVSDKSSGGIEKFKGDLAVFNQAVAATMQERSIDVTSGDTKALKGIAVGTRGAFTVTVLDSVNGATTGGGGYTIALTNCMVSDNSTKHPHAKFADGTITFEAYAPDGVTDPLVVTAL